METNGDIITQEWIEEHYNRKHIDTKIREEILGNEDMVAKLEQGVDLVNAYLNQVYLMANGEPLVSKNLRIAQLKSMDVPALVLDIFTGIAYCLRAELFTSVTAQMAARLQFSDKCEAIATIGELLAVLCATDAFDIDKPARMASLQVVSCIPLSEGLIHFIKGSQILPPMLCEPLELKHNYSSGYLTHNDSLVLGSGNHHDGDLCLDTLNIVNKVAFRLDTQFLSTVEELPTFELDTQDKIEGWHDFKNQSYFFYSLLAQNGNRFHFTNKVDKRGRTYSCGYHLNPQGTPFKKAMLELAKEEIVTGVPT